MPSRCGSARSSNAVILVWKPSCGGYFKTGRVLKYNGTAHNRLLASLCNAMDVPVDSFGASGYGGPLSELSA